MGHPRKGSANLGYFYSNNRKIYTFAWSSCYTSWWLERFSWSFLLLLQSTAQILLFERLASSQEAHNGYLAQSHALQDMSHLRHAGCCSSPTADAADWQEPKQRTQQFPWQQLKLPRTGGNSREPHRKFYMRNMQRNTTRWASSSASTLDSSERVSMTAHLCKAVTNGEDVEEERPRGSEKLAWCPSGTPLPWHRSGDVSECNTNIQLFKVYDYFFKQQLAC